MARHPFLIRTSKGSNPFTPNLLKFTSNLVASITQLVRVPNCGFGSYGFKSRYSPFLYSFVKNTENKKSSYIPINVIPTKIWLSISGGVNSVAIIKLKKYIIFLSFTRVFVGNLNKKKLIKRQELRTIFKEKKISIKKFKYS